jgi:radical SAM superfamily enzyme with C-terminal helix-hairpin-helix motif
MGNSTLPTVLDKLCMVANINIRKLIEILKAEIKLKEIKLKNWHKRLILYNGR